MRLFVSTTAGHTVVALLLSGVISVYGRRAESACTTVPRASSDDSDSDILVTYNTTQQRCVTDLVNKNNPNVYKSLFDCVTKCSPEQGAPFCAVGPFGKCDDRETDPEREAFFYNIQTQRCEP
uniref:Putative serine proteinase inhibitor n=1 Tax=Amblyomma americanum TaxID=6943 RepID=A0A0C9SEV6_AMBAM